MIMNEVLQKDRMHDLMPLPAKLPFGIALKWAAFEQDETLEAFLFLGRSKSVAEAQSAVKKIRTIPLNLIFADKDNIAWQVTGRFPLRKKGRGLLPSPGWDGEYDWQGYLDVSLHPKAVNPPEGYVATANNRTISPNESFILSSSWEYPERIERIRELIESTNLHTVEDSTSLQNDVFSPLVPKIKNTIFKEPLFTEILTEIQSWNNEDRKARAQEAIQILKRFNGSFHPNSAEAPISGALLHTYTLNTFLDELGPSGSNVWQSFLDNSNICYSPIMDHIIYRGDESPFWDNITTPEIETKAQILAASLADSILLIEKELGKERKEWQWGKMHTVQFKTETTKLAEYLGITKKIAIKFLSSFFDRGPYPAGGSFTTVNVARYNLAKNFDVWLIPEMRIVVDFSKEEPLIAINSTGQSDNPVSPHYEDGIHAWREGRYQPFPFKKDNIEKQYNRILTMLPFDETNKKNIKTQ
jgi:acyl-homoserine-lactone acylase